MGIKQAATEGNDMNTLPTTARILAAFTAIYNHQADSDLGAHEVAAVAPRILYWLGQEDIGRAEVWVRELIQRMEDDHQARRGMRDATAEARAILDA